MKYNYKFVLERETGEVVAMAEAKSYETLLEKQGQIERKFNLNK